MKPLFTLFSLGLLLTPAWAAERVLPVPDEEAFVYFSADKAHVEPQTKKVTLDGNVQIRQKTPQGNTRTITGEKITFDRLNTQFEAQGPVTIEDGKGGVVTGNDISLNYTTQDFSATNMTTDYPPLHAKFLLKTVQKFYAKPPLPAATNPTRTIHFQ